MSAESNHVVSPKIYALILLALLAGTLVTVVVARKDLGPLNIVVALSIAGAKAALVVLYFMHLRYSERLTRVFAAAALFWLVVLIAITMVDYYTR
jgi:cytochrome c oxidase subunit 4